MSGNQEEVENIEDMEKFQIEVVELCESTMNDIFSKFDSVVKMPNANATKKTEMEELDKRLSELQNELEFLKKNSALDVPTKEKLNIIYESVKLKINELKKQRYPGAESYFLPNTLNRGFSVQTPVPSAPPQGPAFNIFSPRAQKPSGPPQGPAFNIFSPTVKKPSAFKSYAAVKKYGGSKKTKRKTINNKRKSRKSRG